ncbi:MAG: Rpn family recombination-promoting nuclease/putative transposase [Hymenobacter sp.]|nr:MAG: Rpn family recombination-promoting nuclease/putative transposase [Hymenobacter sp.]
MQPDFPHPFISLISDYGFKATFGNEKNTLFLRRALQALIQSDVPIAEVTFLPNELVRLNPDSRGGVYDLACTDDQGRYFIVEMQLSEYPEFIQRMKFYSLYRFNTLVLRGDYRFERLPHIYCIGIMATTVYPHIAAYHNTAALRNETGELMDDQTVFITVELSKFEKQPPAITTDLDKLLYTMKTLHQAPADPIQWPEFWDEDWIKLAIKELSLRNMDPEELLLYQVTMAKNAHAVYVVNKQLEKAQQDGIQQGLEQGVQQGIEQGIQQGVQQGIEQGVEQGIQQGIEQGIEAGKLSATVDTVKNLLVMNVLTVAQIAAVANVSLEFVVAIQAGEEVK